MKFECRACITISWSHLLLGFGVLTEVKVREFCRYVAPCTLVGGYEFFGETRCLPS